MRKALRRDLSTKRVGFTRQRAQYQNFQTGRSLCRSSRKDSIEQFATPGVCVSMSGLRSPPARFTRGHERFHDRTAARAFRCWNWCTPLTRRRYVDVHHNSEKESKCSPGRTRPSCRALILKSPQASPRGGRAKTHDGVDALGKQEPCKKHGASNRNKAPAAWCLSRAK